MNAVVTTVAAPLAYADIERLAVSIAKSNLFGIKTPDQALALMMIAHAEGRHPALAARDYDIIQNKPVKKAEAMLRDFLSAGGKVHWHALDDAIADATFSHPTGGTVRIAWNMERAAVAQLANKDMYKKFPRQMLRSRVVSEGVRTIWPSATSGMYIPEEVADNFSGPTLDATPEPQSFDAPSQEASLHPVTTTEKTQKKQTTAAEWLDNLNETLSSEDNEGIQRIIDSPDVARMRGWLKNGALERLNEIIASHTLASSSFGGSSKTIDDGSAMTDGNMAWPGEAAE